MFTCSKCHQLRMTSEYRQLTIHGTRFSSFSCLACEGRVIRLWYRITRNRY